MSRRHQLLAPLLALMLALVLGGCSGAGESGGEAAGETSAAEQAAASALLDSYESARVGGNFEVAESLADQLRDKYPDSRAAARLGPELEQVRSGAAAARAQRRLRDLWEYQALAVGKGVQRSASIYSRTVPVEEGEVAPTPDAQLVLRDHPSWGRSAYLLLAQSRFTCGKPCRMQIRFDQQPARQFAGKQADSGKGPALFIEDEADFINALAKAGEIRIQLPKGSGSITSLVFETGGYQPQSFEKPPVRAPAR
jgi:hypothetical protein